MNYRLITDASDSARTLALIGAQVRQERARARQEAEKAFIRATARQMNVDLGREIPEALR